MISYTLLFSAQRVTQAIRELRDRLRGKPAPEPTSGSAAFESDPFASYREAMNTAKAAYDKDPRDAASYAKLQFAIALYRDLSYTNATRIQMNRLGVQNQIRGSFELSRCAVDNNIT